MLSVAGADHIITMDLHASQIQVGAKIEEVLTCSNLSLFTALQASRQSALFRHSSDQDLGTRDWKGLVESVRRGWGMGNIIDVLDQTKHIESCVNECWASK